MSQVAPQRQLRMGPTVGPQDGITHRVDPRTRTTPCICPSMPTAMTRTSGHCDNTSATLARVAAAHWAGGVSAHPGRGERKAKERPAAAKTVP
jgi:hypothetical protein